GAGRRKLQRAALNGETELAGLVPVVLKESLKVLVVCKLRLEGHPEGEIPVVKVSLEQHACVLDGLVDPLQLLDGLFGFHLGRKELPSQAPRPDFADPRGRLLEVFRRRILKDYILSAE